MERVYSFNPGAHKGGKKRELWNSVTYGNYSLTKNRQVKRSLICISRRLLLLLLFRTFKSWFVMHHQPVYLPDVLCTYIYITITNINCWAIHKLQNRINWSSRSMHSGHIVCNSKLHHAGWLS